ncbi:MAG: hypothetical protein ABI640_13085 [Gammaproteobacteria bacterium]
MNAAGSQEHDDETARLPRRRPTEFSFWLQEPSDFERVAELQNAEAKSAGQFLGGAILFVIAVALIVGASWLGHHLGMQTAADIQPTECVSVPYELGDRPACTRKEAQR